MYEWHKAIKLNYINTRINAVVVLRVSKHFLQHMHSQLYGSRLNFADCAFWYMHAHCLKDMSCVMWRSAVRVAVFGTARSPHFSLALISVTIQLWIWVFWVISVYFNIRNTLPKFGTFLLGQPVFKRFQHICQGKMSLSKSEITTKK
jgi:hypothetical protein